MFTTYILPKLSGEKSFYLNRAAIKSYQKNVSEKVDDKPHFLILLSSFDEVSSPYPIDRVQYEQRFIPLLLEYLITAGFKATIRPHPRSHVQLDKSKEINGSYAQFVTKLEALSDRSPKIHLIQPGDDITSYELMPQLHTCHFAIQY